jgi:hypothetical protein
MEYTCIQHDDNLVEMKDPTMFRASAYYDFAANGTRFTDDLDRVWEKQTQYKHGFLVGLTKDTPSFTVEQLKGIVIEGFRVLPSSHEKDDSDKRSLPSRFLRR